jgi:hypothetical protein
MIGRDKTVSFMSPIGGRVLFVRNSGGFFFSSMIAENAENENKKFLTTKSFAQRVFQSLRSCSTWKDKVQN